MDIQTVITGNDITKKYKGFTMEVPKIQIPKGFATALIGENGAGKTTLLNILAGIRLDFKGEINYFGQWNSIDDGAARENIGYTGPGNYFLPQWNIKQVGDISELLFDNFHKERYDALCEELCIRTQEFNHRAKKDKKVKELSDGNRMKLMLAAVLARDTKLLLLDEPASPLDPLMRDKLCDLIRDYLDKGNGENSVFFSTHNIMDMENVTDYAIIMEHGTIVEEGFVEDLKEKYIVVKGEKQDLETAKEILYTCTANNYGFEGICLAADVDKLAGMDIKLEMPSLSQISVAVMKVNTNMKLGR